MSAARNAPLLAGALLAPGCAMSFGGAPEHRPAIQAELDSEPTTTFRSTWSPDARLMERAILESVKDGGSPRDDSPTWRGPAYTAGAHATGERPGVSNSAERAARREEHDEHVGKRTAKEQDPLPRREEVDRVLDAWGQWQAERGVPPIDLDDK